MGLILLRFLKKSECSLIPSKNSEAIVHNLSGRRIFITGGTGFVGRSLLDRLQLVHERDGQLFHVSVLSRDPDSFLRQWPEYAGNSWLSFIRGSLSDLPAEMASYTDVIHAAADTHIHGHGAEWISQIVNGTAAVLAFAVRCGAERFLLTSSGAVYGPQPADVERLREDFPGAPPTGSQGSTYGQAKRVAEQLCTVFHQEYGLNTVVARCFAFSGRHIPTDGPYAIGNFIRDALNGSDIRIKGNGLAVRSYLAAEDMADWLIALLHQGKAGEAYNVGSDQGITMVGLAKTVCTLLAPQQQVIIEGIGIQEMVRSRYIPDVQKALALGLRSRFSLEEIVLRTAAQLRTGRMSTRQYGE